MEKQGLISVIVPIYQVEKELPRCLNSLLAQTYSDFELLLIDDGSKDGCFRVMEEYARKDKRIRIFQKENGGVSSARNLGLEQARGEYVCFVDADDWVAPQYLEWMYQTIIQTGLRMVFCRFSQVEQDGFVFDLPEQSPEPILIEVDQYSVWGQNTCQQCWQIMADAELFQDVRFKTNLALGEDSLLTMQLMLKAERVACVPCALYAYWKRRDSAFNQSFTIKQYTEVDAWEEIYTLTRDRGHILKKTVEENLARVYAHVYYRMAHSPYADQAKQKELIRKIREHWRAVLRVPSRLKREKGKMLMMMTCPSLGRFLWRIGTRMKK